jgi:hypothetical protein
MAGENMSPLKASKASKPESNMKTPLGSQQEKENELSNKFASGTEKINENSIDFCCCLSLNKPSFYLFLNVLDLVYATLITMLTILFTVGETTSTMIDYLKVSLGTLNILLFGLAVVSFIFYLTQTKYNTPVHKIYAIVRLVVCGIRYFLYNPLT